MGTSSWTEIEILKGGGTVAKAEGHNEALVMSSGGNEGGFPLVAPKNA